MMTKKGENEKVDTLRTEIAALDVQVYRLDEQKKTAKALQKEKVEQLSNICAALEDGQTPLSITVEKK